MTRIEVTIDEDTVKRLVHAHLRLMLGADLKPDDIRIQVKSKQNYRAEWEEAQLRAVVTKTEHE